MNTTISPLCRAGVLSAGLLLAAWAPALAAEKTVSEDAFPNFESYIKISGQSAWINGDESAFQSRARQPADGSAGIEDLHVSRDLSKTTTLVLDGKALTGSEDYLGRLNVTKNEVGSFEVGYKRFRTFYDGVGGFFPTNGQWLPLNNQDLHVDRSKFWIEGTLAKPGTPTVTVRYTNDLRTGKKDSLIWGSSDLTGLPFNLAPNPINPARKFNSSFVKLGERNEELELTVKQKIRKTDLQLTFRSEQGNNLDTRSFTNYPGEVIPWSIASLATTAQPAAKAAAPVTSWNNQVLTLESEGSKSKTAIATLESSTPLTEKLTLKVNGNYELVHATVLGDRPVITSTATSTGIVAVSTNNYANLIGGTRLKSLVGNIALDWKPTKTLFLKLGYRSQEEYVRGTSTFDVLAATGTPAVTVASTPRIGWAKLEQQINTPVVEARYIGIKDVSLYFNGSKRDTSGVERNTSAYNPLTAGSGTLAIQNVSENHGNYAVGGTWRASSFLNFRSEVFTKGHKDLSQGFESRAADHFLLDLRYTGYKLTATTKVLPGLDLTTRYVSQVGKGEVTGFLPTYPAFDSMDMRTHTISESIDWTPSKNFYAQANANVIYNVINTIYPRAGLTAATSTAAAFDTNRVLQNSNNNYLTLGLLTGWAVDRNTDAQIAWNSYRAANGNTALSALAMPFGVAAKDTSVTIGLKHRFSDKWIGHAKVGYFDSTNDTTGGMTNYHGPLAYLAIEHAL